MKTSQHLALILTLALGPVIGCGDDDGATDAAVLPDGAAPDVVVADGDTPDTPTPDGVTPDGGTDAGTPDAGDDAGPVACETRTVPTLDVEQVGDFNTPVYVTAAPDDPDRLYVVEKRGRILIIEDGETLPTPFLQIGGLLTDGEQGLLGLAFHPDYATNGRFFVYNTPGDPRRNTVDEYHRSDADPMVADADMVTRLVSINDSRSNHNGGPIAFGPDGFLYAGLGDGGGGGDPDDTGLDPDTLLGSILRLDVDNAAGDYAAAGNPYIDGGGQPQIWAIGIRNAWRISFDRMTGDLYVADVGQGEWEEIDVLAPGDGGANLGWSAYEGFEVYSAGKVDRVAVHHEPIHVFQHGNFDGPTVRGGVSITGGYVYRGAAIEGLQGFYLFGDYQSQDIGALHYCDGESISEQRVPSLEGVESGLASFGEDGHGEMYMVFLSGGVYRIIPRGMINAPRERTAALAHQLRAAALIPAGLPVPRNYPGNPFPFRASSHFLYFVGRPLEGGFLLVDGGHATVFLDEPDADDALWHGPAPSFGELSSELGFTVAPKSKLKAALESAGEVATVPAPDAATREVQASLLGRPLQRSGLDAGLEDAIVALRLSHDAAAQAELERAAAATVEAHIAGMAATAPGVTEAAVCAAMEYSLAKNGCGTAYGSIVTVHGEVLHNHLHDGVCQAGDLLLADVGAETPGGWAGDVTRTWPVSGTFSPTQTDIYSVVLASQRDAIDRVRVGVRYRDVHLTAARTITQGLVDLGILRGSVDSLVERGVHALFFPHGVGHLLGLDVHDMEDLGDRAGYAPGRVRDDQFGLSYLRLDRDLELGMAVTIEPGFYQVPAILNDEARTAFAKDALDRDRLAAFADVRGIRIEDDVLVTAGDPAVLTQAAPKEIDAVEAAVRA